MTPTDSIALLVLQSPLFHKHHAEADHPECPERLLAAEAGLGDALAQLASVRVHRIDPRTATRAQLERVHAPLYLDHLQAIRGQSGFLDADTFFSSHSLAAAELAAGGAAAMVDGLLARQAQLGVGLVRPPGHHATTDRAMGFCLLNNVAVAAGHALSCGASRVLIVDWDVHHGNGTQDIFYGDNRVLYFSIHQADWYPGSGHTSEIGTGAGRGFTVNVPLHSGAGDAAYRAAIERLLIPVLNQFAPDLILVSAGYDAHQRDPLGQMRVTCAGFGNLAHLLALANAQGPRCPIGLLLEGGYDLTALRDSVAATIVGLVHGYHGKSVPNWEPSPISPLHSSEIEGALAGQTNFWRF